MSECITDELLAAWASGNATPEAVSSVHSHIASCTSCRTVAAEVARTAGARPKLPTLGRYVVTESIGEGGMGTVYSAWDPTVGRNVAVKVLHDTAKDGHRAARFLLERQVLASLEHPHIARLLDAGETEDGKPWFAMDFIDGEPIDTACDRSNLLPKQRMELMLPVLRAVTAAHQNLVVHRDLKPSNILVDRAGEPRLVDFGIARLLEGASGLTQTGVTPMTPAYASPEQVYREAISVTSDVYSLGVVLYELLTGVSPYETPAGDSDAVMRAIVRSDVKPPSEAVLRATDAQVAARGLSREKLRAALQGDLDAIVMMALRKSPGDRYQSVQALTDDLVAALDGQPTLARRGDRAYRAALFVRRNRALIIGGSAVIATLSVGLVSTIWQARQTAHERDLAQARFEQVRQLAKVVLFDYHDGIADLAGSTPMRQRMVKDSQSYLAALSKQVEGDASLEQELADSYLKLGDVQGDPFAASLGDTQAAAESYREGLRLAQSLNGTAARMTIADATHKLAAIDEVSGNLNDAVKGYEAASALRAELLKTAPGDVRLLSSRARDELAIGQTQLQLSRVEPAAQHIEESVKLRREIITIEDEPVYRRGLAASLISLCNVRGEQNRFDEAIAAGEESMRIFEKLSVANPDSSDFKRGVGTALNMLEQMYRFNGDRSKSVEIGQRQLALAREAVAKDPENSSAQHDLIVALASIAQSLDGADRYEESWRVNEECIALQRKRLVADPANLQTRRDLMQTLSRSAWTAVALGTPDIAIARSKEVLAIKLPEGADNEVSNERRADAWHSLSMGLLLKNEFAEAREASENFASGLQEMLTKDPSLKRIENRVAIAQAVQADLAIRTAEKTNKRADWEYADAKLKRADASAEALQGTPEEMPALARTKAQRATFHQHIDAGLAGKPLPPLPPMTEDGLLL